MVLRVYSDHCDLVRAEAKEDGVGRPRNLVLAAVDY
jgi:hypothetical protein